MDRQARARWSARQERQIPRDERGEHLKQDSALDGVGRLGIFERTARPWTGFSGFLRVPFDRPDGVGEGEQRAVVMRGPMVVGTVPPSSAGTMP